MSEVILSASTVTGNLTLGNYIGAIDHWKKLQEQYQCYYMIADLHGLTNRHDPKVFKEYCYSFFAQYLALGLDCRKNTIFIQSQVQEHAELSWILNCFASMGDLNRMTQFKDYMAKNKKGVNAGLFTYPVLMAADILLYDTNLVPVGDDQKQHLEFCRDLVKTFHHYHGETFVVPEIYLGKKGSRIMSLIDPTKKMSKSDENPMAFISITDSPTDITKKIKSATTDSGSEIKFSEDKLGISNLLTIYSCLSDKSIEQLEKDYCQKMYGHLKKDLAELICQTLEPIQKKYHQYMSDREELEKIIKKGAQQAREKASEVLRRVYDRIGLIRV